MTAPSTLESLWQEVLLRLARQLNEAAFEAWFRQAKPVAFKNNCLTFALPNEFARDYVSGRFSPTLKLILQDITGEEVEVKVITLNPSHPLSENNHPMSPTIETETHQFLLNPKYTFDTFVVGNSNRFAHAAALAVADTPAKAYNPLFIYGGVGLGKTHLLQAIGHQVRKHLNNLKVAYVTSEHFTNELINAIRDDTTVEFRQKYRNVDVLLVDDVQFLEGKERTQEEFFHTFNTLYEASKQIVLSSDRPPKDIATLEERLRSRFEWGLITDIQPPDFETRIAILRKKAQLEGISVPDEIMAFIAQKIQSNIRELEGALLRVAAYSSLTQQEVTVTMAEEILKDTLTLGKPKPITPKLIQEIVAEYFNLKPEELKAKKRNHAVAFPRQIAMYLTRELTNSSLPKIGEEFGGRDHTTVMHACEKINNSLKNDASLRQIIIHLTEKIRSA
ncbi:MAG: chromosomal replication initiator protein [Clostridia bacterium]|nr:chromosomal replication initiator protein [Clostridia bacterium]